MSNKVFNIGASHGEEEIIFHLRSISVAEENRFTARFADISDMDSLERKAEQEYEIFTDAIASWSESKPTLKGKAGEDTSFPEGALVETPAEAVAAYFKESNAEKERTAQAVILTFRRKLQPKVVFY